MSNALSLKPDSQKSTVEHASDWVKGKTDSMASSMQPSVIYSSFVLEIPLTFFFPQSQKSGSQSAGDTLTGNSNENKDSLLNKAKSAVGMDK